jgi:hypothetical protein
MIWRRWWCCGGGGGGGGGGGAGVDDKMNMSVTRSPRNNTALSGCGSVTSPISGDAASALLEVIVTAVRSPFFYSLKSDSYRLYSVNYVKIKEAK